jgi:putative restriction endonuclease
VECALCSITEARLIEAAHIVPKSAQGSDDVRNGLPLCLLHHKASESDVALIRIEPDTLNIVCEDGRSFEELKVTKTQLQTRTGKTPRKEALQYLWDETATYLAVEPAYRYNLMYPKHERP